MSETPEIRIQELDIELIQPSTKTFRNHEQGGSKIVVIGAPGSGKTTLITSLLYGKKHIIPCGIVMSGTEDSNGHYGKVFPNTFVYNKYNGEVLENFIKRQKLAKQHLENPWAVCLIDDCMDDPALFRSPLQQAMYKNGRHWKMLYIMSLQYAMDLRPSIRTSIDGCFILREPRLTTRKVIWENYASIIPDFGTFCQLMDQLTNDFSAIYIQNAIRTNDWRDCVFWYKAPANLPRDFKFGSPDFWDFHYARFNPEYVDPISI